MSLIRSDDHQYRWTEGDEPLGVSGWQPGVTTVLKQLDKSGPFWAAASRIVAEKAVENIDRLDEMIEQDGTEAATSWLKASTRDKSKKAMNLGTRIHQFAEDEAKGQAHVFADDAAPYVAQYRAGFLERYQPTMEHIEEMVYSERGRYGGTFDVICSIAQGVCPSTADHFMLAGHEKPCRWLIDYKTSDKRIGKGPTQFPYPDTGLQLAALGYADFIGGESDEKHPIPPIDHYGVVAITPDDCQLIEYDVQEADFQTFLHLRNIHEWVMTRKKEIKR